MYWRTCHIAIHPIYIIHLMPLHTSGVQPNEHITTVLRDTLHWISVAQTIEYKIAPMTFNCVHCTSPAYFHQAFIQKFTCGGKQEASHMSSDYKLYKASIGPKVESHTKSILYVMAALCTL